MRRFIQLIIAVLFLTNRVDGSEITAQNPCPTLKGTLKPSFQMGGGSLASAGVSWFALERISFDLLAGLSYARYFDPEKRKNITDIPLIVFFRIPLYLVNRGYRFRLSVIPAFSLVQSFQGATGFACGGGIGYGYQFGKILASIEGIAYWGFYTGLQYRFGLVLKL